MFKPRRDPFRTRGCCVHHCLDAFLETETVRPCPELVSLSLQRALVDCVWASSPTGLSQREKLSDTSLEGHSVALRRLGQTFSTYIQGEGWVQRHFAGKL